MTLITKTIEYAFPTTTGSVVTAAAAYKVLPSISIFIPETSSRVIKSALLRTFVHDAQAAAASLTAPAIAFKLGSGSVSTYYNPSLGAPPVNSGENHSYMWIRDLTTYFQSQSILPSSATQISGTVSASFGTVSTAALGAKLYITYTYDDVGQTNLIKTVRIPLESPIDGFTANTMKTLNSPSGSTTVGQIPALDTFLPEAQKVYRQIWFEFFVNEGTTAAATSWLTVSASLDSETPVAIASPISGSQNSAVANWFTWIRNDMNTATTHSLNMGVNNAMSCPHPAVLLNVTYEYDRAATVAGGRQINSLMQVLPNMSYAGFPLQANSMISSTRRVSDIWIQEPGPINLRNSGVMFAYSQTANIFPSFSIGRQKFRVYQDTNALFCGASFALQRIDSGSSQSLAMDFDRGKNEIEWKVSIPTAGVTPSGFSALLYLNYESGVPSGSPDLANRSTIWNVLQSGGGTAVWNITAPIVPIFINEPYYFINELGVLTDNVFVAAPAASARTALVVGAEINTGSATTYTELGLQTATSSFVEQLRTAYITDGEAGWYPSWDTSDGPWERWKGDPLVPSGAMKLESSSRRWRVVSSAANTGQAALLLTHHNITSSISGAVSNYTGDGSGITLNVYSNNGSLIITGSTQVGGGYNIPWYDNTQPVFVYAQQDATHIGSSNTGSAV
jgi:hypothetical protein